MSTQAMGATFALTPAGGTLATVGSLQKIGEIACTSEDIDVTTLDAPNGYRAYKRGFKDAGELTLSGFHDKSAESGQATLRAAYESGALCACVVTFSDDTTASFSAYVKGHTLGAAEVDGAVGFSCVLKLSGGVTVGEAA